MYFIVVSQSWILFSELLKKRITEVVYWSNSLSYRSVGRTKCCYPSWEPRELRNSNNLLLFIKTNLKTNLISQWLCFAVCIMYSPLLEVIIVLSYSAYCVLRFHVYLQLLVRDVTRGRGILERGTLTALCTVTWGMFALLMCQLPVPGPCGISHCSRPNVVDRYSVKSQVCNWH